jgi:hypothetical protein
MNEKKHENALTKQAINSSDRASISNPLADLLFVDFLSK